MNATFLRSGLLGALLLIQISALLLLPACRQSSETKTRLRIGHEADVVSLDPIAASDHISISVLSNIYDSLTDFDRDMKLVPSLAESWENPDDNTWVFAIRKNVRMHTGEILTAADVKFSIDRARSDSASSLKQLLSVIQQTEIVDATHLKIITNSTSPLLAYYLASVFISPKSNDREISNRPVGTGPFRFAGRHSGTIGVDAFPQCWRGAPEISHIDFVTIQQDDEAIMKSLENGQVDLLRWVPEKLAKRVAAIPGISLVTHESLRACYLWMNSSDGAKNPFHDVKVRQAVAIALDRSALVRELGGYDIPLQELIPPGMQGNIDLPDQPKWNPDQSKKLLTEAGYPNGFDTDFYCAPGAELIAQIVRTMLFKVGIRVRIQMLEWPTMRQKWQSSELPFLFGSWRFASGEPSSFLNACIVSRHPDNTTSWNSGYSNPICDQMITQYLRLSDPKKRDKLLQLLMKELNQDLPMIPLFRRSDLYAVRKNLRWQPRLDGSLRGDEIYQRTN